MASGPYGPRRRGAPAYRRYHGGPDPLAPPVDLAEALAELADEVMSGTSPENALRELLRRGTRERSGLDDLARRVDQRRRDLLRKNRLDGTLSEVKRLLDEAVLTERKQLARDLDDEARFAEFRLAELPKATAAAVNELREYDWRSPQARQTYEQIADLMGREAMDQRFAGMKQALEGASEADREAARQMLADLNELLEAHARGDDTDQQFADFMDTHGQYFPEQPQTVEELIDALAARAAAGARMRNSLTEEQRAELDALAQQAFGSPELMEQLSRMDANLQGLRPGQDWDGDAEFSGQRGMGMGEATDALQELADLDELGDQLSQSYAGAAIDDVDLDLLAKRLGDESAVDARQLSELERLLRSQGLLQTEPDGSLRLTPQALRRLGKTLLADVAQRLSGRSGRRDTRTTGAAGEYSGSSRAWEFGDTEPWDVPRTITNALTRRAGEPAGDGLTLGMDDIEVIETEARTRAAVVLLVDTSFSMAIEGRWLPMKRTALALHQLITTRFRGDELSMITFGRYAASTDIGALTALPPHHEQGTNLHHGLLLAQRFFSRHSSAQPVLLIVTDGEPTAHLEPDGEAFFTYPPMPQSLRLTVQALDVTTRLGAQTTFFRLGEDPGLVRFLDRLAQRADGRVVAPGVDDLGSAVIDSYLSARSYPFGW